MAAAKKESPMKSQELKVSPLSDYYVYAPSALAQKLYLYPLSVGYFMYEPGYYIRRSSFDSFLIMYLTKGSVDAISDGQHFRADAGEFLLLDCYRPHQYGSPDSWEAAWLHFDGELARAYYQEITSHYGNVLNPANPMALSRTLNEICGLFRNAAPIVEATLSAHITDILNGLLIPAAENRKISAYAEMIADSVAFINEHFQEPLTLEAIAKKATLSPYYFTRIFTREIGFTPHQYLINVRISAAKFLLKSSELSVKDIAFGTGFNSESSFCSTFKKWTGSTPSQYRGQIL